MILYQQIQKFYQLQQYIVHQKNYNKFMSSIINSLQEITVDEVQNRNKKIRQYLNEQKDQMILRLVEQQHQIITVKKNKYACCPEDLEKGLNMFVQASKNLLNVYFPIFMDEKYLELLCEGEINEKVMQLKSMIDKNWNYIYKQLVKPKEQLEQIKRKIKKEEKKKGKNCKIPVESACVMQKWLLENFSDPYPSHSKKVQMAKQSNLSLYQVNNWFINARQRVVKKFYKKQSLKNMKDESDQE